MKLKILTFIFFVSFCGSFSKISANTKEFSLSELIELARIENFSIQRDSISKTRTEIAVSQAYHQFLPTVDASISNRYQYLNDDGFDLYNTSITASIGASINIFNGLKDINTLKKAQLLQESSQATYQWKLESLNYEVAIYYFNILAKLESVNLAESTVEMQEDLLKIATQKLEIGNIKRADYLKQRADTQNSKQSFLSTKMDYELSLLNLKKYIDYDFQKDIIVKKISVLNLVENIITELDDTQRKEKIKNLRHDIQAQELEIEASKKNYKAVRSGYFPTLNLSTNISDGYNYDFIDEESRGFGEGSLNGSVSLTLSYKIFNKFSTSDNLKDINEQIRSLQLSYEESLKNIDYENKEALLELKTAISKLEFATSQLEFAKESWELTKASFEGGVVSNSDLVSAKNTLLNAELNLLQTQFDIVVKWLDLKYYSGEIINAINEKL